MENDIVCSCRKVTDEQIRAAVRKGAQTLDQMKEETGCCGVCGLCVEDVRRIIAEAKARDEEGVSRLAKKS